MNYSIFRIEQITHKSIGINISRDKLNHHCLISKGFDPLELAQGEVGFICGYRTREKLHADRLGKSSTPTH